MHANRPQADPGVFAFTRPARMQLPHRNLAQPDMPDMPNLPACPAVVARAARLLLGLAAWAALGAQAQVIPRCPALLPEQVLAQLNALRAEARHCGTQAFAAAAPLRWQSQLAESAALYAQELARRDTLTHRGEQSQSLRQRLRESGYRLRQGGENLAAGTADVEESLAQWLLSPEHCANLMNPAFEDAALACASNLGEYGRYWVLHLGAPLPAVPATAPR